MPKKPTLIRKSLNFTALEELLALTAVKGDHRFEFQIFSLQGFIANVPPVVVSSNSRDMAVNIYSSSLAFYLPDGRLIDEEVCSWLVLSSSKELIGRGLFANYDKIRFQLCSNINYEHEVCPYVFLNTRMIFLSLGIFRSDYFVRDNSLKIMLLNRSVESKFPALNSQITSLFALQIQRTRLDSKLLNAHVFWFTHEIWLGQLLADVQVEVFKPFLNLNSIYLHLQNMREFFSLLHQQMDVFSQLQVFREERRMELTSSVLERRLGHLPVSRRRFLSLQILPA